MYLAIKGDRDAKTLQQDLDTLAHWEKKWQMEFHPGKCQVITISRNKKTRTSNYILHGQALEKVTSAKYLGLTITSDMRWNSHISNTTTKANRTLAFLRRNLRISSPRLKETAYQTLVRPLLEYASTVWDPYTENNIHRLEMVQRRAARYVLSRYRNTSSVSDMYTQLQWTTLQERRRTARLCMFFKIHHGAVAINPEDHMTRLNRTTRHVNSQGYRLPHSRADYHLHSFFPRTIRDWNQLPEDVVTAPSPPVFRERLEAARRV